MRRFFLIPLLAFGTIAGFASGFHSLHMRHHCGWHDDWQRSAYEQPLVGPQPPLALQQQSPAPVTVQQQAPAPAPAQTLVIPIIVGVPQGAAPAAPTTYVVPVPTTVQPPAASK